jgi:very-short-patch-repair endonuclease
MRKQIATPDRVYARIAGRQYGVVRYDQLVWAGLVPSAITRRVTTGRLHRLYRGVYAVGHTNLSREGRWIAAVFACGPGAVLSHESAAHLWRLSPTSPPMIHVTVPATSGRSNRPGIRLHRSSTLRPNDTTLRRNIPVTTPARTLADLGWAKERTRSDLERLFLRICREHDIPMPEVNVRIGPHTVDFLWREARLVVEVDGYAYHSDRRTFRTDRARDRYLGQRGLVVLRYADTELDESPGEVASSVLARLRQRL